MSYVKFIPSYYVLQESEACPEFQALSSEEQVEIENNVSHYHEYIENAVTTAYTLFIKPYESKNVIYSKPWGK